MVNLKAQDFGITVNVSDSGSEQNYNLSIGFSPDATDGYDSDFDEYAPPAPPPPIFDAALTWGSDRFYTQIVNGSADDLVEHQFVISMTYDTGNSNIITWDNTGWSEMMSSSLIQDQFGGIFINVNMINPELSTVNAAMATFDYSDPVHPVLTVTNAAITALNFSVTPNNYQAPNSVPSFTGGGDLTVNEDAGEQSITEWATDISAGPPNENDQYLTFTLTTDNDDLFYAFPAIDSLGNLTYTPGENLNGIANVTVVLSDDLGLETSQGFIITVNAVNDPPSMTYPSDTTSFLMGLGPVTIEGWATNISAGPEDESDQVVTADPASSSNASGFFVSMPVLEIETGNLSFEWESDANVIANMLIQLTDDGGTENGGDDDYNFNFYLESTPVLADFTYEVSGLTVEFTNTTQYVGDGTLTYS